MKASEKTPRTSQAKSPQAKTTGSRGSASARPRGKPATTQTRKAAAHPEAQAPARKAAEPRRQFTPIRPVENLRPYWVALLSLVGVDLVLFLIVLLR
jgi:hypothetical protein